MLAGEAGKILLRKEGFDVRLVSMKMNRFAYMSFVADDKSAARHAFSAVGDSWEQKVWQNAANFQSAKKWALGR